MVAGNKSEARQIPTIDNPNIFNLHVSINYVKDWGKWHALRELYQNLYDASLMLLNRETGNLLVRHQPKENANLYIFADKTKNPPKSLGYVEYASAKQRIIFSNELGDMILSLRCLILGGSDARKHEKEENSPLAGEFGEGFKLAMLALLRAGCKVRVIVRDKIWRFFMKADPLFEHEVCLHVEIIDNNRNSDVVEIKVKGITQDDFTLFRRRMLLITDVDTNYLVPTKKGIVLNSAKYAGYMFSNGIYVCENPCGWKQTFGIDAFYLKTDRNRMAFQEPEKLMIDTSEIVGETVSVIASDERREFEARGLVDKVFPTVNWAHLRYLHKYLNPQAIEFFWQKFISEHPTQQPTSIHQPKDEQGREEYLVAIKFPKLYVSVDFYLLQILRRSPHFRSPHAWLNEVITRAAYAVPEEERQQFEGAIQWISGARLNINNVVILENDPNHNDISCVKNNCLYIPKAQVDKEKEILTTIEPVPLILTRALQMLAVRCKSSDFCIHL